MCGLIGLEGNFDKDLLFSMIEMLKHRGEDSSGYYLYQDGKISMNNDFHGEDMSLFDNDSIGDNSSFLDNKIIFNQDTEANSGYSFALAHNLLSIFNLIGDNNEIMDNIANNRQPIMMDNFVLVFNGEIYNFDNLVGYLKSHIDLKFKIESDGQLLIYLLKYHFLICGNLLDAVKKTVSLLDGDYSFAVFDNINRNFAVCRDQIGVKPLYYSIGNEIKAFASEKKALWKIGFNEDDIYDLKPGSILYNWEIVDLDNTLLNKIIKLDLIDYKNKYDTYEEYLSNKKSYDLYKKLLLDELKFAVAKRVKNISDIGLIFSGGVDSTILAVLLKEIAIERKKEISEGMLTLPLNIKLFSVGKENSQDIEFSQKIAEYLNLDLKTIIIDENTVNNSVSDVLIAIEDPNIMKIGVGMTIYLASKAIKEDNIKVAIAGQGADELFGGYNRYLKHFDNNSLFDAYFDLDTEIRHDIYNIHHVNLERDDAVSMACGVELRVPFLDKNVVDLALDIPAKYKITSSKDILRKHILRDIAHDLNIPGFVADRPKKAAQYGSGINKILKKRVLKDFDIEKFLEDYKKSL